MANVINATSTGNGGLVSTGDDSGILNIQTNETTAITVDASQNVGIGTASPVSKLNVNGGSVTLAETNTGAYNIDFQSRTASTNARIQYDQLTNTTGQLLFYTNGGSLTERMRIDSSGNLLVGTTSTSETTGVGLKMLYSTVNPEFATVQNTANANATYVYYNTNATNNGYRFYVTANGGVNNFSGNNTNLSDKRTKTNITLADNYLDKICAIPVKTFNYKDEPSGEQKTLGLIAQDVQQIAPEFVNSDGKWEAPEGESPLLSIYSTDMMFALMKSIQELKSINDTQAETINALTARIVALEGQ